MDNGINSKYNAREVSKRVNPEKPPQRLSLEQIARGAQETKAHEHKIYEQDLLIQEQVNRDKIRNLVYNSVNEAIKNNDKSKQLIGKFVIQEQYTTKMRAFQDKDGRILLGPIDHVGDAFNKKSHQIENTDLDNLKIGEVRNGIKRIAIDENLLEIFRDRGFTADIAKGGELKKVGTLHGKWNEKKGEMDMTFNEYKVDQSGRGNDASPAKCTLLTQGGGTPTDKPPTGDQGNQGDQPTGNQGDPQGDQPTGNQGDQPTGNQGDQPTGNQGN